MTTRFLIDPAQTNEEIVEFIMSMLEEDGAPEGTDAALGETQPMEHPGPSDRKAHGQRKRR